MFEKYLLCFFISMVPMIELRGAILFAAGWELDYLHALWVCVLGNMLPMPFIYLFARKVLTWGADRPYIGKFFTLCLKKGEQGGRKLEARAGKGGLFLAPEPGRALSPPPCWTWSLRAPPLRFPSGLCWRVLS